MIISLKPGQSLAKRIHDLERSPKQNRPWLQLPDLLNPPPLASFNHLTYLYSYSTHTPPRTYFGAFVPLHHIPTWLPCCSCPSTFFTIRSLQFPQSQSVSQSVVYSLPERSLSTRCILLHRNQASLSTGTHFPATLSHTWPRIRLKYIFSIRLSLLVPQLTLRPSTRFDPVHPFGPSTLNPPFDRHP